MSKLKLAVNDILVVSKLTKTKNKKLRILLSVIISNISVASDILIILFFADFFQNKSSFFVIDFIKENLFILPFIVLLRFLCMYFEKINILGMQLEIDKNLKKYLINEVFDKGNYSTADAFFYVGQLSGHVAYFYTSVTFLLNISIQIIGYLLYLIIYNLDSFSFFILAGVLLIYPTKKLASLLRKYVDLSYHENRKLHDDIQKLIDNMYLIKLLKKSKDEISFFNEKVKNFQMYQFKNYQYGTTNALIPPFFTLLTLSCLFVLIKNLSFLTLEFIGIVLRLFQQIGELNKNIGNVINSHVHLEKLYMVEKNKLIINSENFVIEKKLNKNDAVILKNVTFRYLGSENNIFENLDLEIKRNKHTIITGTNGSGKSTLLGICTGVFYADEGKVESFSNNFGYIGVSPLILSDSLRNNLIYGNNESVSDSEIIDLVKRFKLFSDSKDIDLSMEVNNKSLSSGQMQKISFIRALLSRVEILILDESMSNLDSKTKELIYSILNELEITVINSTHSQEGLDYDHHLEIKLINDKRNVQLIE